MSHTAADLLNLVQALDCVVTDSGERLAELSRRSPVLLVFLRHAGCPFCREALGDIGRARRAIAATGTRIVLVHMGDTGAIRRQMEKYGVADVDRIRDQEQRLYRAFGLRRASLRQLTAPRVIWRGLCAAIVARHGMGRVTADAFQLPGAFLIGDAAILRRFRHRTAADRPDYLTMCGVSRAS